MINVKVRAKIPALKTKVEYVYKKVPLNKKQVETLIDEILKGAMQSAINDLKNKWIINYVPKRTGQLRDSLITNLDSSKVDSKAAKMRMGTTLSYVKYVIKMNQKNVRHRNKMGTAYYNRVYGKIILNDPKAIGKFWGFMLMYARERFRHYIKFEIKTRVPKGQRRPYTTKLRVIS